MKKPTKLNHLQASFNMAGLTPQAEATNRISSLGSISSRSAELTSWLDSALHSIFNYLCSIMH